MRIRIQHSSEESVLPLDPRLEPAVKSLARHSNSIHPYRGMLEQAWQSDRARFEVDLTYFVQNLLRREVPHMRAFIPGYSYL